jgi:20S proteasome subunit alpha 3
LLKLSSAAFNSNILAGVAGITSDANSLVNYARTAAQKHLFSYDEEIPVEMLAQRLCDLKQGYTQYGGKSVERVCYPS